MTDRYNEGYRLARPSRASTVAALARMFGAQGAAVRWRDACTRCDVDPEHEALPPSLLARVAEVLIASGGMESIVGRSLMVRMLTFESLATDEQEDSR